MRGTKHDASQHQRRGIRSRLIASVAAVAMLATSIAAGTAVAVDIDETDPTQQNTIVEQPQQGTENAGDQTGEQNTEPEGDQTDQPQESGDTATETEGDNTTEADSTEEADPKTDVDKTDGDQLVVKQSDAVPAPQTANAADAEVSTQAEGEGSQLLDESFTGTSVSDDVKFFGTACLTAASDGDYSCNRNKYPNGLTNGVKKYQGRPNGYLQLTDDSNSDSRSKGSQTGTVLYNRVIQSRLGLDIEFDTWQFSTENINDDGDGIGFFLTDGSYDLSKQGPQGSGFGGALGYSAIKDGNSTEPGIAHGVLGVGLDVYGNFSSTTDVGGSDVRESGDKLHANSVSVRGAGVQDGSGEWTRGYGLLDGRLDATHTTTGGWVPSWETHSMLTTDEPGVSKSVGAENDATHVRIHLEPLADGETTQQLTVTVTEGDGHSQSKTWELSEPLPTLIKFGFSASTGQNSSAHFIRNVTVNTVREAESGILMTKTVRREGDGATDKTVFSAGDTVPYDFTVQNVGDKPLDGINIEDQHKMVGDITCEATALQAGDQTTCHGSLVLSEDDTSSGTFVNTATAYGTDSDGKQVESTSSVSINTVKSLPAPAHKKRLEQCSDGSCEFELSLDVTGAAEGGSTSTPADVVIVLDKSGSMDYSMYWDSEAGRNEDSRWDISTEAIGTLLNGLLGEGKDNRVSLVTFSDSTGYYYDSPYNDAEQNQGWTSTASDITGAVNRIQQPSGGTNWEAGLREASELLDTARDDASKYVVFVSDGDPTYYYNSSGLTTGNGGSYDPTAYSQALKQAKSLDATVFSIGVGPQNNVKKMESFAKNVNGEDGYYYSGASESDLNKAVEDIVQTIRTQSSYTDVTIADTLSKYMEFAFPADEAASNVRVTAAYADEFDHEGLPDPVAPSGSNLEVVVQGRKITVSFPGFDLQNGVVYTVTFKVTPTQEAYDEAVWTEAHVSQGHPSNDPDAGATLSYRNKVTSSASGDSSGELKTVAYDEKPMFTVPASTITVSKEWTSEPHPGTATIRLYRDGHPYLDPVSVGGDGYTFYVPAGPDGHTYKVEETGSEGWVPSYSYTAQSPSYVTKNEDGVKLKGLCAQTATAKVTNTPKTYTYDVDAHLNLRKNLTNGSLSKGDFKFILTVEHPTDKDGITLYDMEDNKIEAGEDGSLTETVANGTDSDASVVQFGKIEFSEQGMYMVSVREPAEGREDGIRYDDRTLYVLYVLDGSMNMKRYIHRAAADEKAPAVPTDSGSIDKSIWIPADESVSIDSDLLTWNNTITVSSLPLTGGRSTARTLLLAGGGVLLVAGAAWLLARRRRV